MSKKISRLLKFDKSDIILYLIFGVGLLYIWKTSNISINYLFPFIILCVVIYLRQEMSHGIELKQDHKLSEIKNNILKGKYKFLERNSEIIYFLNDIYIYNIYNPANFTTFLNLLDKFYSNNDIIYLHICLETFENFIFTLPLQMLKNQYLKKLELNKILVKNLKNSKYKMVEMQSYIPYNFFDNKSNYVI